MPLTTDISAQEIARNENNRLAKGTRLAEFEILEVLGEGAFGVVYLAQDHSLQRTIAIKEYMPSMLALRQSDKSILVRSERFADTYSAGLRSFVNEVRLLAQFEHPALIKVYRYWEENGTAYIAMPHYVGSTLKQIRATAPARVNEIWLTKLLMPLMGALDTLHQADCFHRDIALDNILVQEDNTPVLLDFGAARKIIGNMVEEMTVLLKPGFAPIEQYTDDQSFKQGAWTDIYALGAVLYSLIANKTPPSAIVRIIQDEYTPLSTNAELLTHYSPRLLEAVDKALALKPADRPQSIPEFAALLGMRPHPKKTGVYQLDPITAQDIARRQPLSAQTSSHAQTIEPLALFAAEEPTPVFHSPIPAPEPAQIIAAPVIPNPLHQAPPKAPEPAKAPARPYTPAAQAPNDFDPEEIAVQKEARTTRPSVRTSTPVSRVNVILMGACLLLLILLLIGGLMLYKQKTKTTPSAPTATVSTTSTPEEPAKTPKEIDDMNWAAAKKKNTTEAYWEYLDRNREGAYKRDALRLYTELLAQEQRKGKK